MTGEVSGARPAPSDERPRPARWVLAPASVGGLLFTVGLLVEVRCAVGRCPAAGWSRFVALDGAGALPRLFTAAVFLAVGLLAALAAVRSTGWARWWWAAVVGVGVVLGTAKAVSASSTVEQGGGRYTTLVGGVLLSVIGLPLLWRAGRRWAVRGATPVTLALAGCAVAVLGLDQVTEAVRSVSSSPVALAVATYVEEGGEAVAALLLLAATSAWRPRRVIDAPGGVSRRGW
ncbi:MULTISPECIES: hypothetical protein [Modestobacter]|uniref:DUF998 domain-containing protein n=1 Tax=Modestobacter caceresii TaxID=1522368 RepID=A0A098Y0B0_9ACTN|nr:MULTISPECIES: hypothetical protein [Modestobacter]KGH43641.1 hypothetical protein IN07_23935 [Modestobacter caceresii]